MSNNNFEPPEFLADVQKLRDRIDELQKRLELVEQNREKVRQKIYEKVKGDYQKKLDEMYGELKPFQEKIEAEISSLEEQIGKHQEVADSSQETLEEYQLRFFAGEFAEDDFEPLQREMNDKIEDNRNQIAGLQGHIREFQKHLAFITGEPVEEEVSEGEDVMDEAVEEAGEEDEEAEFLPVDDSGDEEDDDFLEDEGDLDEGIRLAEEDHLEEEPEEGLEDEVEELADFKPEHDLLDQPVMEGTDEGHHLMKDTVDSEVMAGQGYELGEEAVVAEDEDAEEYIWSGNPVLDVVDGDFTGESYTIDKERITMGRGPNNDIQLATDTSVSRHHAQISQEGQKYVLVDLESSNGTSVNGIRISRAVLKPNDEIMVGQSKLIIRTQD